jgi:hypothetical protein
LLESVNLSIYLVFALQRVASLKSLRHWHAIAHAQSQARRGEKLGLLHTYFHQLKTYSCETRHERLQTVRAARVHHKHVRRLAQTAFVRGRADTRQQRVDKRLTLLLRERRVHGLLRGCFVRWRGSWLRRLLYTVRDQDIQLQRTHTLNALKTKEIEDLEGRDAQLRANVCELESNLVSLQETLAAKEMEIAEVRPACVCVCVCVTYPPVPSNVESVVVLCGSRAGSVCSRRRRRRRRRWRR